jgi:GT2 family glycosyltransferase
MKIINGWAYINNSYQKAEPSDEIKDHGFSIVICTNNRSNSLEKFLISLEKSSILPDSLIIVDSSNNSNSERKLIKHITLKIKRIIYIKIPYLKRGLTYQRNIGVKFLNTPYACFFDDDIILKKDTLNNLIKAIIRKKKIIAVACIIENETFIKIPIRWKIRKIFNLWDDDKIGFLTKYGIAIPQNLFINFKGNKKVTIVPGGATCWKTEVLRKSKFCENFKGYGQAEDIEYSIRTIKYGEKYISGNARVLHMHEKKNRINQYNYGLQTSIHGLRIFKKYADRKILYFYVYIFWQLLDILMILANILRSRKNMMYLLGRLHGHILGMVE